MSERITLLDLAKTNGNDKSIALVEEGVKVCPEVATIPSRSIAGTSYSFARRVGRPSVGFRKANDGVDSGKSRYEKVDAKMFILGGLIEMDKAIADADEEGPEAAQTREAVAYTQAALLAMAKQVWYGTAADEDGFEGVQKLLGAATVANGGRLFLSDTTSGSNNTSIYLVRFGDDGISFDFGKNTTLELSDFREESIVGENGKKLPGYVADLCGWAGMRLGTVEGAMRIANIRKQDGKAGLSDAIIEEALSNWTGRAPDAIFMNRKARFLLQQSRTVTTTQSTAKAPSTLGPFAQTPTEAAGIPIFVTDALTQTEAFVS